VAKLRTIARRLSGRAQVAAAVPVRRREAGGLEFLLVRTSDGKRWTFPKGGRERGESLATTATREAAEEAGVAGRVGAALGAYEYTSPRRDATDVVAAFLLHVERSDLRAEPGRDPTWFGLEAARSRLAAGRDVGYGEQMERLLLAAQHAAAVK
jgi:8-oxo-dGTP pyrophosphatase MutT (NUDIX family)